MHSTNAKNHPFRSRELIWILSPKNALLPQLYFDLEVMQVNFQPVTAGLYVKRRNKSLNIVHNSGLSHEASVRIAFPKLKALMGQPACSVISPETTLCKL